MNKERLKKLIYDLDITTKDIQKSMIESIESANTESNSLREQAEKKCKDAKVKFESQVLGKG